MIHSLMRSSMSRSKVRRVFMAAASRMMPDTTGMTWVMMMVMIAKMATSVSTDSSQSGAVRPLKRMSLSERNIGWPIREMTKAAMM